MLGFVRDKQWHFCHVPLLLAEPKERRFPFFPLMWCSPYYTYSGQNSHTSHHRKRENLLREKIPKDIFDVEKAFRSVSPYSNYSWKWKVRKSATIQYSLLLQCTHTHTLHFGQNQWHMTGATSKWYWNWGEFPQDKVLTVWNYLCPLNLAYWHLQ